MKHYRVRNGRRVMFHVAPKDKYYCHYATDSNSKSQQSKPLSNVTYAIFVNQTIICLWLSYCLVTQ